MCISALCLALALVLPFLTGQIQSIGNMLCPMHLPVMLCGFLCGGLWGLAVGTVAPLLRSLIFGMPVMFPAAVCMAAELAVYGFLTGFLYKRFPKKMPWIYIALLTAMIAGRIVWGLSRLLLLGLFGTPFTLQMFLTAAFVTAWPGMILQLVLIPPVVRLLEKTGLTGGN